MNINLFFNELILNKIIIKIIFNKNGKTEEINRANF